MIVFALLAALGLLISIAANVPTFFGVEPMHRWGYLWLLHLGIFVVLIIVAAWIFGVFVPAGIMRRSVAASCPECGGRVRCESVMNWTYRGTECGHFEKRTK
jgi:hypothetical protein